jgi:hypothetical protein
LPLFSLAEILHHLLLQAVFVGLGRSNLCLCLVILLVVQSALSSRSLMFALSKSLIRPRKDILLPSLV